MYKLNITNVLSTFDAWAPLFVACCISWIVVTRILRLAAANGKLHEVDTRNDVALRITWFLALGFLAWYQLFLDVVSYGWSSSFNTIFRFSFGSDVRVPNPYSAGVFASSVEVVVIGLICCSVMVVKPTKPQHYTKIVTYIVCGILFGIFCIDEFFFDGASIRQAQSRPRLSPYDFGITTFSESNVGWPCAAGYLFLILSAWLRNSNRTHPYSILSVVTLLIGLGVAVVVDGLVVNGSYPIIVESVFANQTARIFLAILTTSVPAAVYAWRHAIRDRAAVECSKALGSGNLIDRLEFVAVLSLFISSCLSFSSNAYNLATPWLVDFLRLSGAKFFRLALPIVCSGFALGRWVKMHWSSAIVAPSCLYSEVSLSTFFSAFLYAQCWILAFSILTAWLVTRSSLLTLVAFLSPY